MREFLLKYNSAIILEKATEEEVIDRINNNGSNKVCYKIFELIPVKIVTKTVVTLERNAEE